MKKFNLYLSLFIALFIFHSCEVKVDTGSSSSENKERNQENTSTNTYETQTQTQGNTMRAKFVDFHLGDASHYYFIDDKGKEWDFAAIDDESFEFAVELPAKEINDENQGWGPNKDLQGKWFNIKFELKEMPQYQDGPMATLPVIVEVKPE
jgi:hypothetical protein